MPIALLLAQLGVTLLLLKSTPTAQFHVGATSAPWAGFASGSVFSSIGLAFLLLGPVIVYIGTRDVFLTLGFFVIRALESYVVSLVLTASVLASLGIHTGTVPIRTPSDRTSSTQVAPQRTSPAHRKRDSDRRERRRSRAKLGRRTK